jgi:hypothetical protein
MSFLKASAPYDPSQAKTAVIQPTIYDPPPLRKLWFKNTIVCEEGWSLSYSGSTWRIDTYDYRDEGRQLILGGEGAAGQMDIFLSSKLLWTNPSNTPLDEETSHRVLRNITAALQWAGYRVGFFALD